MIVFNGHTSGLTEVHYQGHSIKEVHSALGKVWPEEVSVKLREVMQDSSVYEVPCNGDSTLRHSEVSGSPISIEIGDCVTTIENWFSNGPSKAELTSITFGNSVTTIGQGAFTVCSGLTSLDIPDNVTTIGPQAFIQSYGMTSLTIGSGCTEIGQWAFWGCSGLTAITINATTPPTLGSIPFDNTNDCPIYVPCGSVDVYKTAWSDYASRITCVIPPSDKIGRVRFQQKESGSSYTYADKIFFGEGIADSELIAPQVYSYEMSGETAYPMKAKMSNFTSLINMQSIKFPNTTRYVESDFGYNMQGTSENYRDLQMIILNDGLIELKDSAFYQSDNSSVWRRLFKYLIIPSSVQRIGKNALRLISPIASAYSPNTPMSVYFMSETPPMMSDGIFAYSSETVTTMNSNYVLYVPVGCIDAYKAALPSNHQNIPMYEYSESDLNRVNETINAYAQTQGLID